MQFSLLITLALATPILAATKTGSASTSKSTGSNTKTHTIMVSDTKGALTFSPSVLSAAVGHKVEFMFHPNNHSVAQAAFDSPCAPMESSTSMKGMQGFYSGFMPVNGSTAGTKTFTITVNSTNPMWFYCSQGKHCQAGMVGVINPTNTSSQTLESFVAAAKGATSNVSPAKVAGGTVKEVGAANVAAAGGTQTAKGGKATATAQTTKANAKATTAAAANEATSAGSGSGANVQATGANAVSIAAASAVSTAAKNGTGITQSNVATRASGLLDFGSSLGLMVVLAGSLALLA